MEARTALLDAAEALVAERGVGAVSLREVGVAAGQRNNSAAQYHFGSREGLLRAVFERRMVPINDARQAMLDALDRSAGPDDLRALVDALVTPLADAVTGAPASTYARFLAQVLASAIVADSDDDEPFSAAFREVLGRMAANLGDLDGAVQRLRAEHAVLLLVHSLAAWEKARALGRPHADPAVLRADLIDTVTALLDAPSTAPPTEPSPTRRRRSTTTPPVTTQELAC